MNPHCRGINITGGEPDSLTKAQPHAVYGEEKDLIAGDGGGGKELRELIVTQDIWNACVLWRLDQGKITPGSVKDASIEELQAVQIQLDRTP